MSLHDLTPWFTTIGIQPLAFLMLVFAFAYLSVNKILYTILECCWNLTH